MRRPAPVVPLAVLCTLSVVATGLAVVAPAVAAGAHTAPAVHAVVPSEHSARLVAVDRAGAALAGALTAPSADVAQAAAVSELAAKPSTTLRTAALTPAVAVPSGISVVGATWPEGAMPQAARLLIRTSTKGQWSAWQALDSDDGHGPDAGTAEAAQERGGTQPYVVTDASAVQVRLDTASGTAPAGAAVDVVDPGTSTADSSVGTTTAGAAQATAQQPTIYSRAQWGADERLRKGTVLYGSIQAAFVHHTVSQNNYTAAQVPAIIRGIYAFHVNGRGWNDIGYNFLVDRFGRIWEGRYGGITRAVVGAHTLNYNSNSFAMSAIGNFDVAHVPSAIVSAYERLFAWKLTLHGTPATGTVVLNNKRINRISGHRDVGSTACPGRYLYALLPTIRAGTARLMGTLPRAALARSLDPNGTPDILTRTGGTASFASDARLPVNGTGRVVFASGWDGLDQVSLSPDLTGDGRPDLVARQKSTGQMRVYAGNGHGGFANPTVNGAGWGGLVRVLAPGDVDGDGHADLLATDPAGRLRLYSGTGHGWVASARFVSGTGWNAMSALGAVGDLNGDGRRDLLGIPTATGALSLYPGLGNGDFGPAQVLASGWSGVANAIVGAGDLDGDGHVDVVVREAAGTGRMRTYYGTGTGAVTGALFWGSGWQSISSIVSGQDIDGDGHPDLMAVKGGALVAYAGTGQREFSAATTHLSADLSGTDQDFVLGDLDRDGYSEVVARDTATSSLMLYADVASASPPAPRQIGTGWGGMKAIAPAGDMTMDGIPDILGLTTTGNLILYPLTSTGGFARSVLLATGLTSTTDIVGVGPNDTGAAPDVLAQEGPGGPLVLHDGNGVGAFIGSRVLATSSPDVADLVAGGDVDGNGLTDVVVQRPDGTISLLPAGSPTTGGFGAARSLVTSSQVVGRVLG